MSGSYLRNGCLAVFALAVLYDPAALAADLRGHGGPVRALEMGPAGSALTGSFDTRAILWDLDTGTAQAVMALHAGGVNAVAFLGDGRPVTGGQDGRVAIWSADGRAPVEVRSDHDAPISDIAVLPDGTGFASGSWDGTVAMVVPGREKPLRLEGHDGPVNALAFLPDGHLVTAGYDGTLRFWSANGNFGRVVSLGFPLNALALGPDGAIWVAGADGHLRAFDLAGELLREIDVDAVPLVSLAVSSRTRQLAAGAVDGQISIMDLARAEVSASIATGGSPVWSLAFDAETGVLMAGGPDNVVRGWDVVSGAPLWSRPDAVAEAPGESRGARVFQACAACHSLTADDGRRAGPTLHGIFGRQIATAPGYGYSDALKSMDLVWTPETVSELFDVGPTAYTPGTRMPEQRIPNAEDRDALIAFLRDWTGGMP